MSLSFASAGINRPRTIPSVNYLKSENIWTIQACDRLVICPPDAPAGAKFGATDAGHDATNRHQYSRHGLSWVFALRGVELYIRLSGQHRRTLPCFASRKNVITVGTQECNAGWPWSLKRFSCACTIGTDESFC